MKFGIETAESVQFCSMRSPKNEENYYQILSEIKFDKKNQLKKSGRIENEKI